MFLVKNVLYICIYFFSTYIYSMLSQNTAYKNPHKYITFVTLNY